MIVFQNGQLLLQISTLYSSSLKHLSMKREKCYDNETDKNGYLIIMRQKTPTSVWKSYNLLVWGQITLIWPKSRGPVSHKHTPCSHLTATPSHLNRHRIWESALLVTLPFLRDQAINATSKNPPTRPLSSICTILKAAQVLDIKMQFPGNRYMSKCT